MRGRHTDICRCWLPGTRWYVLHDYISMPRTSEIFHGKEPLASWWGWDTHIVRGEHDLTCTPKPGKQFTSRTPRCLIGLEGNIYICQIKSHHLVIAWKLDAIFRTLYPQKSIRYPSLQVWMQGKGVNLADSINAWRCYDLGNQSSSIPQFLPYCHME